ncbi:MAG: DUF433 domain-containing protein [Pseudomonadota bacterium]
MSLPTPLITVSADMMGGTPVFTGTRVPIKTLFDYLTEGEPLAEFLEDFPTVSREHAKAVLTSAATVVVQNEVFEADLENA